MVANIKNKLLIFLIFLVIYNLFNIAGDVILIFNENFHQSRLGGYICYFSSIIPACIYTLAYQNKYLFVKKYLFFAIIYFPIIFLSFSHFIVKEAVAVSSMEFLCLLIAGFSSFFDLLYILVCVLTDYINRIEYSLFIMEAIAIVINTLGVFIYIKINILLTNVLYNKINKKNNKG